VRAHIHSIPPTPTPLLQLDNETGLLTWTSPSVVPQGVVGFRVLNMNGYNAVDVEVPGMVRLPSCVHCACIHVVNTVQPPPLLPADCQHGVLHGTDAAR